MNSQRRASGFSGWRVVAVLAIAQGCGIGLLQVYGPFVNPLMEAFSVSAGSVGLGMSIFIVMLTGVGPLLGRLVDRGHARGLMVGGVLVMLAGMLVIASAAAPWQLAAGMAVASLGVAAFGPIPANVTVTHWFLARRGTALAVVAAGGAVAGFGLPPLAAWLIETFGWRSAMAGIALGAAAVALPALLLGLIARPALAGQAIDGQPPAPSHAATATSVPAGAPDDAPSGTPDGVAQWLVSADFWLLAVGMALVFAVPVAMGLYLVPFLVEHGVSAPRAALAVSVAAVFGFIGTLGAGLLADRFPPKAVMLTLLALFAASYVVLGLWPGLTTALLAAAGMGLGVGGAAPFGPLFAGLRFGAPVVGRVMGVQGLIGLPLLATGAPLAGWVREVSGNYEPAFLGAAGVLVVAGTLIAMFSLEPPDRAGDATPRRAAVPLGSPSAPR